MAKRNRFKLPHEILVYLADWVDGEPIYAVALTVNQIPHDCVGAKVGTFVLNQTYNFGIKRTLSEV